MERHAGAAAAAPDRLLVGLRRRLRDLPAAAAGLLAATRRCGSRSTASPSRAPIGRQDAPPFVDNQLALTPGGRDPPAARAAAAGGRRRRARLQAVILDASVKEEPLETQTGVRGFFTTEPAVRLEGRFQVRVDRLSPAGEAAGSVSTSVVRTRSMPEGLLTPSASGSATSWCASCSTISMSLWPPTSAPISGRSCAASLAQELALGRVRVGPLAVAEAVLHEVLGHRESSRRPG